MLPQGSRGGADGLEIIHLIYVALQTARGIPLVNGLST
jgi:hypothetical protein